MLRAVLDTRALVPGRQRDFLLQLVAEGAYSPLWGTGVLFELDYVLAAIDARRGRAGSTKQRTRLLAEMKRAFPGATIEASNGRSYDYGLSDPDDGHVAHAAIVGEAEVIVTDDRRAGFPTAPALTEARIRTPTPAQFVADLVAASPDAGVRALRAMSARMATAKRSPAEILDDLKDRYAMTRIVTILLPLLSE